MGMPEELSKRFLEREQIVRDQYHEEIGVMEFQEWCPFLLCLEDTPHVHNICPDCGSVRYGNLSCFVCWQFWGFIRDLTPPEWDPFHLAIGLNRGVEVEEGLKENPQE